MEHTQVGPRRIVEALSGRFGSHGEAARRCTHALYHLLETDSIPRAAAAMAAWMASAAAPRPETGRDRSPLLGRLARRFGIPSDRTDPDRLLLAMQTYYALLVQVVVRQVTGGRSPQGNAGTGLYDWPLTIDGGLFQKLAHELTAEVADFGRQRLLRIPAGHDLFGTIYQELFPKRLRHALGEYYTPGWLAGHVLDQVEYNGNVQTRLLDPCCGSGVFLLEAIRRIRQRNWAIADNSSHTPVDLARQITHSVVGFDLNPLAVLTAKANYLIAMGDLVQELDPIDIPVFLRDAIVDEAGSEVGAALQFDCVVGNPPWIAWDHLPDECREATKPLWHRYGLFNLSANEARHGGGKKDLSMLMIYVAADRYLKDGGRLGMLVTQTAFQSKGAGDGFRRFRLGSDGPWLGVLRVDDLVRAAPFPGAANWTAAVVLEKGRRTAYPVPYVQWSSLDGTVSSEQGKAGFRLVECLAEPIDAARESSPWVIRPAERAIELSRLVGPSDYQAHLGANTGGANGVYWLELMEQTADGLRVRNRTARGKREVAAVEAVLEPDLIYPLLRWSDVARYRAIPSGHLLLAQDVQTRRGIEPSAFRQRYPRSLAYLELFSKVLAGRAAYRRYQEQSAFYSMYNVGPYTIAPIKVVWRRMDRRINAAVVEPAHDPLVGRRAVIPQETCVLIAADSTEEAHYLAAVLNSAIVGWLVHAHSVRGGKGFGTPGILDYIRLRQFSPTDPCHAELAQLSLDAHRRTAEGRDFEDIQQRIDATAGRLWQLAPEETEWIRGQMGSS